MSAVGITIVFVLSFVTLMAIAGLTVGAIALERVNDQIDSETSRSCNVACPANARLNIANSRSGFGIVSGFNHTFSDGGTLPGSAILSGDSNAMVTSADSVIVAGQGNSVANSAGSFIGSGVRNVVAGVSSSVIGGLNNTVLAPLSIVAGGFNNLVDGDDASAIIAGDRNRVRGGSSAIVSGAGNIITETGTFAAAIVTGRRNAIIGSFDHGFIGGGTDNIVGGSSSAVLAGTDNAASGSSSVVVAGTGNTITNTLSFIGAGENNNITADYAAIVGGRNHMITGAGRFAFIGGGDGNRAAGQNSAVVGGANNDCAGVHAAILAGNNNTLGSLAEEASILAGENLVVDLASDRDTAHAANFHTLGSLRTSGVTNVTVATYAVTATDYLITTSAAGVTIELPDGLTDGLNIVLRLDSAEDVTLDPTGTGTELCLIGSACFTASGALTADFGVGHFLYDAETNRWWEVV